MGLTLLAAGCGASPAPTEPSSPRPAQRDPISHTRGPGCKAVADRMAAVIGEHAPSEPEGDVHYHGMYELRCETDRWSDDARSCLATISSDAEADGCLRLLDREQQRALSADRARLAAEPPETHE